MGVCRFQVTQNLLKPLTTPFDDTPVVSVPFDVWTDSCFHTR